MTCAYVAVARERKRSSVRGNLGKKRRKKIKKKKEKREGKGDAFNLKGLFFISKKLI